MRVQWQGKRKRGGMVKDKKRCVVWQRDRGGKSVETYHKCKSLPNMFLFIARVL